MEIMKPREAEGDRDLEVRVCGISRIGMISAKAAPTPLVWSQKKRKRRKRKKKRREEEKRRERERERGGGRGRGKKEQKRTEAESSQYRNTQIHVRF